MDYTSLMEAAPEPSPQPVSPDYTAMMRQAPLPTPAQQQSDSTVATTTTTTETMNASLGGQARQAAAAQGEAELKRFDQNVQTLLMSASRSACPRGFRYYRGSDGYLCGGGSHFILHEEVDALVAGRRPWGPAIEWVNICVPDPFTGMWLEDPGCKVVAPPEDGWHEPMHWDPMQRISRVMSPMPCRYDGTAWPGVLRREDYASMGSGFGLGRRGRPVPQKSAMFVLPVLLYVEQSDYDVMAYIRLFGRCMCTEVSPSQDMKESTTCIHLQISLRVSAMRSETVPTYHNHDKNAQWSRQASPKSPFVCSPSLQSHVVVAAPIIKGWTDSIDRARRRCARWVSRPLSVTLLRLSSAPVAEKERSLRSMPLIGRALLCNRCSEFEICRDSRLFPCAPIGMQVR